MALIYYVGRAASIAQVETITLGGTVAINDTFTVTINGNNVTYTATTTSIETACAGLAAILGAADAPAEHRGFTWVATATTVVGTRNYGGRPHTVSVSKTGSSNTISRTTTVSATGPNFWDNALNWDGGSVPSSGDDVVLGNSSNSLEYGFPGTSVSLGSLRIASTWTGGIGLPVVSPEGFAEYHDTYPVNLSFDEINIDGSGSSSEIRLGACAANTQINIFGGTVRLFSTPSTTAIDVQAGTLIMGDTALGEAISPDAATLKLSPAANATIHAGAAITTITTAGVLTQLPGAASPTTVNNLDGAAVLNAHPTTLSITGGTVIANGSQTITTLSVGPGTLDCREDMSAFTATNVTLRDGAQILDPHLRMTVAGTFTKSFRDLRT